MRRGGAKKRRKESEKGEGKLGKGSFQFLRLIVLNLRQAALSLCLMLWFVFFIWVVALTDVLVGLIW